nr:MAG TPA: hypothetical protein [Caudoviricetes sp.]
MLLQLKQGCYQQVGSPRVKRSNRGLGKRRRLLLFIYHAAG